MRALLAVGLLGISMSFDANAEVGLLNVPAMCGPSEEVLEALAVKMPDPTAIGVGGDSNGQKVATLFAGNGYWALIALVSAERVCVVASGHDWTVVDQAVSY